MDQKQYMVCVNCWTFNHVAWIEDAMNGFCRQNTDFPFVCVIVDDSSTDGEQEVINRYLQAHFDLTEGSFAKEETLDYTLLLAPHLDNKNCRFAVYFLKYNHFQQRKSKKPYVSRWNQMSKYVAICEGDDYWIDSHKLQRQVDYLETHPNHTLCIHAYRRDVYRGDDVSSSVVHKYPQSVDVIPDKDVINGTGMFGATASMVYRYSAVQDYPEWTKSAPVGDRPLKLVLFARGHIAYINEVMSVYRVGVPGSWTARVYRNRRANKQTRQKFIQLMVDFDEWTELKYHALVNKAINDYKKACRKNDFRYGVHRLISIFFPFYQRRKSFNRSLSLKRQFRFVK